jgi:hypothetical protein
VPGWRPLPAASGAMADAEAPVAAKGAGSGLLPRVVVGIFLAADAMRAGTGADAAIINAGAMRLDAWLPPGPLALAAATALAGLP